MADNRAKPGEPDRSGINPSEDYEVRYWCNRDARGAARPGRTAR